jgi:hypothetical protein
MRFNKVRKMRTCCVLLYESWPPTDDPDRELFFVMDNQIVFLAEDEVEQAVSNETCLSEFPPLLLGMTPNP